MYDTIHGQFFSFLADTATPVEYYTTTGTDQTIYFTKDGGARGSANSVFIENCGSAAMYVVPLPYKFQIVIPAYESRNLDLLTVNGIKVLGAAGQKLRYSGCFV